MSSHFAPSYSVVLLVCGVLAGVVAVFEVSLIRELEAQGDAEWIVRLLRVDQVFALILAPAAVLTSLARMRRWRLAAAATRIVSFLLAIVVPVGTAVFLYWWFSVRRVER